jgi:hypothetical protein
VANPFVPGVHRDNLSLQIRAFEQRDSVKIVTYSYRPRGTHFVEYYPHVEKHHIPGMLNFA